MEDAQLQRRFAELAQRAWDSGRYTHTTFLNLMELDLFGRMAKSLRAPYTLWGGAADCERKIIRFGDATLCGYEEDYPISCIRIAPVQAKFADDLTHRDFLGALMNVGIQRDNLGDIRVTDRTGYLFCLTRIADYIVQNMDRVRRTTVACTLVEQLPEDAVLHTETLRVQVASERLDAVVAHLYKLSRSEGQELFAAGRVFVNDRLRENHNYTPVAGDVVSVRGHGRFVYRGIVGSTKKGRCITLVERYV